MSHSNMKELNRNCTNIRNMQIFSTVKKYNMDILSATSVLY